MTAQELFDQCDRLISSYPTGTYRLPTADYPVAGCGFFPVTSGSFHSGCLTTEITPRKLMFVGQDWGCKANLTALGNVPDADIKSGTGKILMELLSDAGIPLADCFFTNALFGVRAGKTNTGPSHGWKDQHFVEHCTNAIQAQIEAIQPRGIVCLGRDAPGLLVRLISACGQWSCAESFKAIDKEDGSVIMPTSVPGIDVAAILLHPSFRRPNARHRSYKGLTGHKAEIAILTDVWSEVNKESKNFLDAPVAELTT